jgi:hypothetical protein
VSLNIPAGVTLEGMGDGTVLHLSYVDGVSGQLMRVYGAMKDLKVTTSTPGWDGVRTLWAEAGGVIDNVLTTGIGFGAQGGQVRGCRIYCTTAADTSGYYCSDGQVENCTVEVTGGE